MFQDYFGARGELLIWPLIGLGIFLVSFVVVMLYVCFGLQDQRKRDHLAALPLEDDATAAGIQNSKTGEAIR